MGSRGSRRRLPPAWSLGVHLSGRPFLALFSEPPPPAGLYVPTFWSKFQHSPGPQRTSAPFHSPDPLCLCTSKLALPHPRQTTPSFFFSRLEISFDANWLLLHASSDSPLTVVP